jgi:hypothetical protein
VGVNSVPAAGAEPDLAAAGVGHREHAWAGALDGHGAVHRTISHAHYLARRGSHPTHLGHRRQVGLRMALESARLPGLPDVSGATETGEPNGGANVGRSRATSGDSEP